MKEKRITAFISALALSAGIAAPCTAAGLTETNISEDSGIVYDAASETEGMIADAVKNNGSTEIKLVNIGGGIAVGVKFGKR